MGAIINQVTQALISHGQSVDQSPTMSHPIVSQGLVNQLKTEMINSKLWSAGTWKLRLEGIVDGVVFQHDIPIMLDVANIESMQKIGD